MLNYILKKFKNILALRFLLIAIFFILFLTDCKKPANNNAPVLNCDARWVKVFADIHLTEAALEFEKNNVRDSMSEVYTQQIFYKNNTTRAQFDSVYKKLVADPEKFLEFYKCVNAELEKSATKN